MSSKKVIVSKGSDTYKLIKEALAQLDLPLSELKSKSILLKPNAGRHVDARLGINTSPEAVAAVADFLLDNGIDNFFIGESPILGVKALEALERSGISAVARERGIKLVDMDEAEPVVIPVPGGRIIDSLKVCRAAVESDYIISIPVMKTHMHTQVSLGLKNMKGCLYKREKVKLHQLSFASEEENIGKPLDQAIADMSLVLFPDLVVIDGVIGQEGMGPSAGNPLNSELVVVSRDCLAADSIASELMGLRADEVFHLLLSKKSRNVSDEKPIQVSPEDYMKWKHEYKKPPSKISFEYSNVSVDDIDSCSACLSTTLMFLKRFQDEIGDYFGDFDPLKLALGKGIDSADPDTLLIGNCAARCKDKAIFIKGCPPVSSDIKKALDKLIKEKYKN